MAITVWTVTIEYDGARFLVNDQAHPHGAHDVGVAPWANKPTAVIPEPDMDAEVAGELYDAVVERAQGMNRSLLGAWEGTRPLF